MDEQVHAANSGRGLVDFLAVETHLVDGPSGLLHFGGCFDEHAGRSTSRVVYGVFGLRVQGAHHEVHHGAWGEELSGGGGAFVGESFEEVFVAAAEKVVRDLGGAYDALTEMFDESFEAFGWHFVRVGPGGVTEDLSEPSRVCLFDLLHDVLQDHTVVLGGAANVVPVASRWDDKRVEIGGDFIVDFFAERFNGCCLFFVPGVTEAFQEQEWEDEVSQVGGVYRAAKDVR